MFPCIRSRRVAWVAACAVLFAALSFTLASLYMQNRPDIMAEICSAAGPAKVRLGAADGGVVPGKSERSVYCADCLNSASLQAVAEPVVTQLFALVAGAQPVLVTDAAGLRANSAPPPPSRGPPARF